MNLAALLEFFFKGCSQGVELVFHKGPDKDIIYWSIEMTGFPDSGVILRGEIKNV